MATDSRFERRAELCRLLVVFRLAALLVTIVYIPLRGEDAPLLSGALVVAAFASYLPLRYWESVSRRFMRHPALLATDLALTSFVLILAGPESPFFYYSLATAGIAGLAYSWTGAAFFSLLQLGAYAGVVAIRDAAGVEATSFQQLVGLPALYPLVAAAGAAVGGLLDRQAQVEQELADVAVRGAAEDERSRMAREMHDSLTKTLQGVSLSAHALALRAQKRPAAVAGEATELAAAADQAAAEARTLILDLRADQPTGTLREAIGDFVARWSESTGIAAAVHANGAELHCADARYELFGILREALENTERHARAGSVEVTVDELDGHVRMRVADDGVGMAAGGDIESLEPSGHFGLIGMAERARRAGGEARLLATAGGGTTVQVTLPSEGAP